MECWSDEILIASIFHLLWQSSEKMWLDKLENSIIILLTKMKMIIIFMVEKFWVLNYAKKRAG